MERFQAAAAALICQGRDPDACTPAERAAWEIAIEFSTLFGNPEAPTIEGEYRLENALAALRGDVGLARGRMRCVQWVAQHGERWHSEPDQRDRIAESLVRHLEVADPNFAILRDEPAALGARLDRYSADPAGAEGKHGAAAILAEIIGLDLDAAGALGVSAAEDEEDDVAVERIRKRLDADVREFLASAKPTSKRL